MINIDFVKAKTAHLGWLTRLSDFLEGKHTLTLNEVISHRHCELGHWIYNEGLQKYGHLPQMQTLESKHQELHNFISYIIELYNKDDFEQAQQEYEKMLKISENVLALIDDMKQIHQPH